MFYKTLEIELADKKGQWQPMQNKHILYGITTRVIDVLFSITAIIL
jgi:hypothetical protein